MKEFTETIKKVFGEDATVFYNPGIQRYQLRLRLKHRTVDITLNENVIKRKIYTAIFDSVKEVIRRNKDAGQA